MQCIIFIGIPASGKTSFFEERFADTHRHINLDTLKTRNRESKEIERIVSLRRPFVVDNTNITPELRSQYISKARSHGYETIGYYFSSKVADALSRNEKRADSVPDVAILGFHKKLILPSYDEDFDYLYYVELCDGDFLISEWE